MRGLVELRDLVLQWSADRGILTNGKVTTQALKLVSEVGELADNTIKGKDVADDIGDCMVVLINLAALHGFTLEHCLNKAYEDIKDRKGFLNAEGTFIKDTDPAYEEALAKHNAEESKIVIDNITITLAPTLFQEYNITVALSNFYIGEFNFIPNHPTTIEDLYKFKGKPVRELKDYLVNTIGGKVYDKA